MSEILKELVPKKGRSNAAVAAKLGISGQLLGQYLSGRHQPKPSFYMAWKRVYGEDLLSMIETNVSHQQKAVNEDKINGRELSENDLTVRSLLSLAESNKTLAESNKILARSHEELVMMLKSTANAPQQIPEAVEARLSDLLVLLAEVGSGKRWHTPQEAVAALSKRLHDRKMKNQ